MGLSTDQGININMAQNVAENAPQAKQNLRADKNLDKTNVASVVAEKDGEKGLGMDLISNMMRKMADNDVEKMNKMIRKNATETFRHEVDMLYQQDSSKDEATVSSGPKSEVLKDKNLNDLKNTVLAKNHYFTNLSTKQKEMFSQYIAAYQTASEELNPTQRAQTKEYKQMKILEDQMKREGMSERGFKDFGDEVKDMTGAVGAEKQQKMNSLLERGKKFFDNKINKDQRELLTELFDVYPRYLMDEHHGDQLNQVKQKLEKKMEDLEQKLEQAGISKKEIEQAKQTFQNEMLSDENEKENKKNSKPMFKGNRYFARSLSGTQKTLVQEYMEAIPKALQVNSQVNGTGVQRLNLRLQELERQLQQEGMSTQQLQDLKVQIKYSIRGSMVKQLADATMLKILHEKTDGDGLKTLPLLVAQRRENFSRETMFSNPKLGGEDFGNYLRGPYWVDKHNMELINNDLISYGKDEIINALIRAKADPDSASDEIKNIEKFAYLITRADGDMTELNKSMQKMMDDLGYVDFRIDDYGAGGEGASDQQRQRQPDYGAYAYTEEDEKEILINRYKALLMRRAIFPDAKTYLETAFKLRKTKQGMVQLGIFSPALEEQISEDARKMAIEKLLEMLKESLIERASFYELSGSAYTINEKKIKSILKNLNNLECALSEEEFKELRDQANKRIFDISNRELQMVNLAYKNNPHPFYAQKKAQLLKLLMRLKEESKIAIEINHDLDAFTAMAPKDGKGEGLAEYIWDDIRIKLADVKYDYAGTDIYQHVLSIVYNSLESIQSIKEEALRLDMENAQKYLEEMKRKEDYRDEGLVSWANELRVMLLFAKKNTKDLNTPIIDHIIALLQMIAK